MDAVCSHDKTPRFLVAPTDGIWCAIPTGRNSNPFSSYRCDFEFGSFRAYTNRVAPMLAFSPRRCSKRPTRSAITVRATRRIEEGFNCNFYDGWVVLGFVWPRFRDYLEFSSSRATRQSVGTKFVIARKALPNGNRRVLPNYRNVIYRSPTCTYRGWRFPRVFVVIAFNGCCRKRRRWLTRQGWKLRIPDISKPAVRGGGVRVGDGEARSP